MRFSPLLTSLSCDVFLCRAQISECDQHLLLPPANVFLFILFALGARVFLTIALDLVISGIHEPVRFLVEAKARVCVSNSKGDVLSQDITDTIWSSFKKLSPFTEEFDMMLKEVRRVRRTKTKTTLHLS